MACMGVLSMKKEKAGLIHVGLARCCIPDASLGSSGNVYLLPRIIVFGFGSTAARDHKRGTGDV